MIWKTSVTVEEINHRCRNTMVDHLGIEFTEVGDRHMSAKMPVDRRTNQPMGIVHGGATATLAETVASAAANYCAEKGEICVGLDLNINHIRAVSSGFVTAKATPLHLGKILKFGKLRLKMKPDNLFQLPDDYCCDY